ncbi:TlpA family protein disulfide reductase [Terrimonas rubra]|uniref:TlpA family protein disulfide reductase n=1 Tax=Terrimonas rubra TaxID=1035890 RepID=A0ABW6A7Z4_9BACT
MKILLLSIFLSFFFTRLMAQQSFELSGSVSLKTATISLLTQDSAIDDIDVATRNGWYKLTGKISENFAYVCLVLEDSQTNIGSWYFFIKPGKMKIDISLNKKTGKYELSYHNIPFVNENREYEKLKTIENSKKLKILEFRRLNNYKKEVIADSINGVYKLINDEWINTMISFVKKDFNTYINLFIFNKEIISSPIGRIRSSVDSLLNMYYSFSEELRNTKIGLHIETELLKRKRVAIGQFAPAFSFTDSLLHQYRLTDLIKQKYVLLSFWDSGCKPCIQSFPMIKSLYTRYKDVLEIVYVSLDPMEVTWKKSLQRYKLPWINTCNLEPYVKDYNLQMLYNVQFVPQYFLLSKDSEIIYHNTQSGDNDDYEKLQETIKKLVE